MEEERNNETAPSKHSATESTKQPETQGDDEEGIGKERVQEKGSWEAKRNGNESATNQPASHPAAKTACHPAFSQSVNHPDTHRQDEKRKARGRGLEEDRMQIRDDETKR